MERWRKGEQDGNHRLLVNLILEVTSHHFHCILFVRRKTLGMAYIQGEGISQVSKYQEAEINGGHLEAANHIYTSWNFHYKWQNNKNNKKS